MESACPLCFWLALKFVAVWSVTAYAPGVLRADVARGFMAPDGRTFTDQGVMTPAAVPHYRAITAAVHGEGALASAQITHCGSFAQHKEIGRAHV